MIKGISPDVERCYVFKDDRKNPPEEQTRVYYKTLDADVAWSVQNRLVEFKQNADQKDQEQRTAVHSGTRERTILLAGITRFENFRDEQGRELVWPVNGNQAAKVKVLSHLRAKYRTELANAIYNDTDLDEAEVANLDSPPPSA